MSTEEFMNELRERHKDDIEEILELLEILKEVQEEEKKIYDFLITSNL
jgi:histone deacetylase complex regulatory component SIN3